MANVPGDVAETLRNDGREKRKTIENNPKITASLERSIAMRAHCRADCCLRKGTLDKNKITCYYRICVDDLDKLGEYIEAHEAYEKAKKVFDSELTKWHDSHNGPQPVCPEEPVLRGYRTADDHVCGLMEVFGKKLHGAMHADVREIPVKPHGKRNSIDMPEKEDTI
ncbi:hypothetical protein Daus18300_010208 [Diaporthe australafricana]|uniref:Uncharacterized protein n=1 Tax=Diaporthe australafricana TaxID=127596 RepID=A0ABR3WB79_9PEZI